MELIEAIETERVNQGLTKADLTKKTNGVVTDSMYSKYVLGKAQPTEEKLISLSKALGKKFELTSSKLESIESTEYKISK